VNWKVSLTQKEYLQNVLQKFDVGCETKFVSTPLAPHFKLSANMSLNIVDECLMFHMPVQWVVLCMLWCARSQICHRT